MGRLTDRHQDIYDRHIKILQLVKEIWSRHKLTIWNNQRGIITSELRVGLQFFFSAHHLILLYICTKFHEEILNSFKIIQLTRNIAIWTLTLKCNLELHWTELIYVLHIALVWRKFEQTFKTNPSINEGDMEWTWKVNRQTDRRMNGLKTWRHNTTRLSMSV